MEQTKFNSQKTFPSVVQWVQLVFVASKLEGLKFNLQLAF